LREKIGTSYSWRLAQHNELPGAHKIVLLAAAPGSEPVIPHVKASSLGERRKKTEINPRQQVKKSLDFSFLRKKSPARAA
jgi:hypothetical protein